MPEIPTQRPASDTQSIEQIVDARIREFLFNLKFLGIGGAILLALLIYFNKDIVNSIVTYGGAQLQRSIEENNKKYLDAVKKEAEQSLDTLRRVKSLSDARNEYILMEQNRLTNKIAEFRDEYFALIRQAESLRKNSEEAHNKAAEQIKTLYETSDVTRTRISQAQAAAQAAVQEADKRIAVLASNFTELKTTVEKDLQKRGIEVTVTSKGLPLDIFDTSGRKPTVFFQFAGLTRDDAETISKAIREKGSWNISGEERTPSAVGTNEVRYNPTDKSAANQLATDANRALQALNKKMRVTIKENRSLNPGLLEIWLYQP